MAVLISERYCPQNHRCPSVRLCPTGALTQKGVAAPIVDESKCTDCGKCTRYCPTGAIRKQAAARL